MSDKLKTKKHYNSFRPDLGFFISLIDVQHWIEDGDDQSIRQHIEVSACVPFFYISGCTPRHTKPT